MFAKPVCFLVASLGFLCPTIQLLIMANSPPTVLILGHSFVKRLLSDIREGFNSEVSLSFGLSGTASVRLSGVGGRTVAKLTRFDLDIISYYQPEIVILEIGTNDLSCIAPEVVGSEIDEFVQLLLGRYSVRVVGWCCVIPRAISFSGYEAFNQKASILNNYLKVVLDPYTGVFVWDHRIFNHPAKNFYSRDGVHLNNSGQYHLYRSYRGAILKALSLL